MKVKHLAIAVAALVALAVVCLAPEPKGHAPRKGPPYERIVSILPSVTELIYAVGAQDRLVGVTTYCDYPPEATKKEKVGDIRVNYEKVLALRPEHRSVEIGWTWLHPDAWGTGANVEAKLLMLRHAFETWGCRRVELKTDALNERSRGAMEAMGATFEGIHRKHMLVRDGENRDSAWYSVTDDEWPAVERGLVARLASRTGHIPTTATPV